MSRRRKTNDEPIGLVIVILLALIAMPIVGVYLITRKETFKRILGWFLFLVGIVFWLFFIIHQR